MTRKTFIPFLIAWTLTIATLSIPAFYVLPSKLGYYPSISSALYHGTGDEITCHRVLWQDFCKAV